MSKHSLNSAYLPTLDGWRTVAIISVIASHSKQVLTTLGLSNHQLLIALSWGRLGVDLFFALSGFLICYRLLYEIKSRGRISLKGFYIRRIFRILPLYWAYLLILFILAKSASLPVSNDEIVSCLLFYRNYIVTLEGGYTSHFWSLAVEEHFYLGWPLFLLLTGHKRALWITPLLALLIHCWRSLDSKLHVFAHFLVDPGVLFRTDARIDALLWGCFAALALTQRPYIKFPVWTTLLLICVLLGAILVHLPALPLATAVLFPLLIVSTVSRPDSVVSKLLELSLVRWIGRLSYSLYVWQTVFLQSSVSHDPEWLLFLKQFPLNFVMIFACAFVSHYLLERPMIYLGRMLAGKFVASKEGGGLCQRKF